MVPMESKVFSKTQKIIIVIIAAAVFVLPFFFKGASLEAVTDGVFLAVLALQAAIDALTMKIYRGLNLLLLVAAVLSALVTSSLHLPERLIGAAIVSLPMLALSVMIGAFGMGDVKLCAVIGFFLGWQKMLAAFFFAVMVAGITAAIARLLRKNGERMPFVPYLAFGTAAAYAVGGYLIEAYTVLLFG